MSAPATARLSLLIVGDDLTQLRALDRQYEAMWREYLSVRGEHVPAFEDAKKRYDESKHQLAEAVHQLLAREGRPALTLVDTCACGREKRVDQSLCVECGDIYDNVHDIDPRDFAGEG